MRPRASTLFIAWCVAVAIGFTWLSVHAGEAGEAAMAPPYWPAGVALPRSSFQPTLVVTLHPECPCSQATVSELERLMRDRAGRLDVDALFVRPRGLAADPRSSSLWARVARIPGVSARVDDEGALAARFGAVTSGQTLLYDGSGALRFAGGITGSRGHEGDNAGRDAVEEILDRGLGLALTPVFGCSLVGGRKP